MIEEHFYVTIDRIAPYRAKLDAAQAKSPRSAVHLYFGNSTLATLGTHPPDWDGSVVEVRA